MSCDREIKKPLNQDEVNKLILAKPPKIHPPFDIIGPLDRYRDDNYEIYNLKKRQFLDAANIYLKENKTAFNSSKTKISQTLDELMKKDFEEEYPEVHLGEDPNGATIRKRSERKIHEVINKEVRVCCVEPWFRRYLVLCKFINAGRRIILKNRLLKNLAVLKTVDQQMVQFLEDQYKKYDNDAYAELFEQFIN